MWCWSMSCFSPGCETRSSLYAWRMFFWGVDVSIKQEGVSRDVEQRTKQCMWWNALTMYRPLDWSHGKGIESLRLCFLVYSLSRAMVLGEVSMASHAVSEMVRFGSVYSVLCQYVALVVSPSPARRMSVCFRDS